jgi:ribose 5-phosphate isomerase A
LPDFLHHSQFEAYQATTPRWVTLPDTMEPKLEAARRALEEVQDGMLLGLGSGTTAAGFIDLLGARVREGLRVTAVATSNASEVQARSYGIPVLQSVDRDLDLTVDGADEIDPRLNLVKGLGGALLREKVVAAASRRMMVIATEDKLVPELGRGPLPLEILPLLWEHTTGAVASLELKPSLRRTDADPFVSDNGNYILDCRFVPPRDLDALASALEHIPGVMGHGLFLGLATEAAIAGDAGVRVIRPA